VMFATKIFKLRSTDVMQGVIYGTRTPEITENDLLTRFDFDETWGTALNRFVVEAVLGLPITPYGKGDQIRGFLALEDSMQSLRLAVENPPQGPEYRVFNQFDAAYSVNQLAEIVRAEAERRGLHPVVEHPANPRMESEQHYYNPIHEHLPALGYQRTRHLEDVIREIFDDLTRFRRRLVARQHVVMPAVKWADADNRSNIARREPPAPPTPPSPEAPPGTGTSSTPSTV
jgi:UDP-sulfoquinovose synthase